MLEINFILTILSRISLSTNNFERLENFLIKKLYSYDDELLPGNVDLIDNLDGTEMPVSCEQHVVAH